MEDRKERNYAIRRRDFVKGSVVAVGALGASGAGAARLVKDTTNLGEEGAPVEAKGTKPGAARKYNAPYTGERLNRIAFPLGGIGAGMICIEGTGALSHFSLRQHPEVFNEPCLFAAICVKGAKKNVARVLEGQVPEWKRFGSPGSGNGSGGSTYGLPRFQEATFLTRFPFAEITLRDPNIPLQVDITGWSPFEPGDPDSASLPVAGIEYRFTNPKRTTVEAVFSFNSRNFMASGNNPTAVKETPGGFILWCGAPADKPWEEGAFAATVANPDAKVNHAWFRGAWFDPLTLAWKDVEAGAVVDHPPVTEGGPPPGASIYVPLKLAPGETKTVTLQLAWYTGQTHLRFGEDVRKGTAATATQFHKPWYAARFANVGEVSKYWREQYADLRANSKRFSDCFYDTNLPAEAVEAVAANLTILKSPTVLRQADGKLWAWEGCADNNGCCHGSCTHVWNYAQALPHLFPSLERTLRETEFGPSQDDQGHQTFRSGLPIRVIVHDFHAAADGQLGGIMKVYRDWRISGDTEWLRKLWPKVKQSLNYCIETWDPGHKGVVEEPHHNTYDIEFWGADGMCTSFYLGAISAAVQMGKALGDGVPDYSSLLEKGTRLAEADLYNGQYFFQKTHWKGLKAQDPLTLKTFGGSYSPEAVEIFKKEGPKYQYGTGCLSDGVLGSWMAAVCGVGQVLNRTKVASHLKSVHRYNLRKDLSDYANPQRPSYALGGEGGLLLCTWPKGGEPSLPFVYSNEVWTGIEYQAASHMIHLGMVQEGLEVVRTCRDRYDGRVRNPFNEYECGHWYARAMSSYALLQALTGARYDAVEKTLYLDPAMPGDFHGYLSTAGGYGTVGVRDGKPFFNVKSGKVEVREIKFQGKNRREAANRKLAEKRQA